MSAPPFHRVVQRGVRDEVKKYISSANPNERDGDNQTALHVAAQQQNVDIVKLLVNKKWDVNAQDINGWTPLHCAADRALLKSCEVLLQSKKIKVNIKNKDQTSPLVYLVRQNPAKVEEDLTVYNHVMGILVEKGADVDAINRNGESALHSAVLRGNVHSIRFLLNNEADVNILNSKKESSLHWAIRMGKEEVVRVLVEYGGDPFLASGKGDTAMELAIASKKEDFISLMSGMAQTCGKALLDSFHSGFLHRFLPRQQQWERQFFVLKDPYLIYYRSDAHDEKPLGCVEIKTATVKEKPNKDKLDKPYTFQIVSADNGRVITLGTERDTEMHRWIDTLRNREDNPSVRISRIQMGDQGLDDTTGTDPFVHLQSLLDMPDNSNCAECGSLSPTFVSAKLGTFVCYSCAIVYEKLEVSPVKSIFFDNWDLSEAMFLKCNGNERSNRKWEAFIPLGSIKPKYGSSEREREAFIRAKYIEKKFEETDVTLDMQALNVAMTKRCRHFESDYRDAFRRTLIAQLCLSDKALNFKLKTSKHFELITLLLNNDTSDNSVNAGMKRLNEDAKVTSGLSLELLAELVGLIRIGGLLMLKRMELPRKKVSQRLRSFLQLYVCAQERMHDMQTEAICQWWMPQMMEILAIGLALVTHHATLNITPDGAEQLRRLYHCFEKNSAVAVWLLLGSHLNDDEFEQESKRQSLGLQQRSEDNLRSKIEAFKTVVNRGLTSVLAVHTHEKMKKRKKESKRNHADRSQKKSSSVLSSTDNTTDSPRDCGGVDMGDSAHELGRLPVLRLLTEDTPLKNEIAEIMDEYPPGIPELLLGVDTTSSTRTFFAPCKAIDRPVGISAPLGQDGDQWITRLSGLLDQLSHLRSIWLKRVVDLSPTILHRQILMLQMHVRYLRVSGDEIPFSVPEVWDAWVAMRQAMEQMVVFIAASSKKNFDPVAASRLLGEWIVLIRWGVSQMVDMQNLEDNLTDTM